jgi:hypothetical protein
MAVGVCGRGYSPFTNQETESGKQEGPRDKMPFKGMPPSDLISQARAHLLKFLLPSKIMSPARD